MKAGLAIIVLGSTLALMTSGVDAYQSRANGSQSYPNYDRQEYQNRSCCSWKTSRAAQADHAFDHFALKAASKFGAERRGALAPLIRPGQSGMPPMVFSQARPRLIVGLFGFLILSQSREAPDL
jgi:hypothetical protein